MMSDVQNMSFRLLCVLLAISASAAGCNNTGSTLIIDEKRLMDCLLKEYNANVRPVRNFHDTVQVTVTSMFISVIDIDEKSHCLRTYVWFEQIWTDIQLTWDPLDYGNVTDIQIPIKSLWNPDIVFLNSVDLVSSEGRLPNVRASVNSSGHVEFRPLLPLTTTCHLDLTDFPFDKQRCRIYIGSWTYDMSTVDLRLPHQHGVPFVQDVLEWDVNNVSLSREEIGYGVDSDGSTNFYPMLVLTVDMSRRSMYFRYVLVIPSVVMAAVVLMAFFVPANANERITMGLLVFFPLLMLIFELGFHLPPEIGTVPTMARYLVYLLLLNLFVIGLSAIVLNCYHRDERVNKVPNWVKKIFFGRLSKLLCIKQTPYVPVPTDFTFRETASADDFPTSQSNTASPAFASPASAEMHNIHGAVNPAKALERTLEDIRIYLKICATAVEGSGPLKSSAADNPTHKELVITEWHQLALVIDRLSFIVLATITFSVTLAFCV